MEGDRNADGLAGDCLIGEVGVAIVFLAIVENIIGKDDREEVCVINKEVATDDCS